ncbi:hypothetical protein BCR34DRAFT_289082 [Clohesyomyces aquaticus]|uniref:Uncharacterized protein n=1 Tax=Clohesyomyces aquaticus TaxID=1231657 RepID=A0A1Y1ZRE8_9PLEO|nr:hypothetical protein BCR34DRAFT_289082 [Clohesyomyces aquaticus]
MRTKLQLEPSPVGDTLQIMQEPQARFPEADRDPVVIAATFLRKVRHHISSNLNEHYGEMLWRTMPIALVITFPAVRSDRAKDRAMNAIERAGSSKSGVPDVRPDDYDDRARGRSTVHDEDLHAGVQRKELSAGDGFMICDLGGGTIDLITYGILAMKPFSVREATVGSGRQCGATWVDCEFIKWFELKLGRENFIKVVGCLAKDRYCTLLKTQLGRILRDFVSSAKSGFSCTVEYFLQLPGALGQVADPARGIVDGDIRLSANDLKGRFQPSLAEACELIKNQVQEARQGEAPSNVKLIGPLNC